MRTRIDARRHRGRMNIASRDGRGRRKRRPYTMPPAPANTAARLTPAGVGALAVVRIAGPGVTEFLAAHFTGKPKPGRTTHGRLRDAGGEEIDDPVVFLAPDSAFAELSLHGGPWVVTRTLRLLESAGFAIADATPDGTDAVERAMLAALPLATTELALRCLLAQPNAWQTADRSPDAMRAMARDAALFNLLRTPTVAIVGIPNAGKSTLANRLFEAERSITADVPGTTRDWVGEIANLDGLAVRLVDTPGLRDTADPIEAEAIARSRGVVASADLVIVLFDATQPLPPQLAIAARHAEPLRVLNKSDAAAVDLPDALRVSAKNGDGIDALRFAVRTHFGVEGIDPARPRWWAVEQRDALRDGRWPFDGAAAAWTSVG
jgi:tRNA modification GTPase